MSNEITNPNRVLTKEGLSWVWGKVKSALGNKADKADTVLTTTLSRGRKESTAVGTGSIAFGYDNTASAQYSTALGYMTEATGAHAHGEGYNTHATGMSSHSEGEYSTASASSSHAEGNQTIAAGNCSHAEGKNTKATGYASHVQGCFNVPDDYTNWTEWVSETSYSVGDKVKVTDGTTIKGYICATANNDAVFTSSNWTEDNKINYAEITGNGAAGATSNARALDWDGNEYLNGTLYVNCDNDSTNGTEVATKSYVDSKNHIIYATCSTSGATQTKEITVSENVTLEEGLCVRVKFTNAQTYSGQPKLKINSLSAISITINSSTSARSYEWAAGEVVDFVYNGTTFSLIKSIASTSYYGTVKLSNSYSSTDQTMAATPYAVNQVYSSKKNTQSAVSSPTASGNSLSFIDTISQNTQGVITPTKKTVATMGAATSSSSGTIGLVPAPSSGDQNKFLTGSGTWAEVDIAGAEITTFTVATTDWSQVTGSTNYYVDISITDATEDTIFLIEYDSNYYQNATAGILATADDDKVTLTTDVIPYGTISGSIFVLNGGITHPNQSDDTKLNKSNVVADYDPTATYASGDFCLHNGMLYKATSAISTAEEWDISHWTPTTIIYEFTTHKHSASDITSGTLGLTRGGSGQTGTGGIATAADIATAETGVTISTAQYAYWGKVAMLRLAVRRSSAVSSGTTTICTLKTGKRPKYNAMATCTSPNTSIQYAEILSTGQVQIKGAISANNTTYTIESTFVLA